MADTNYTHALPAEIVQPEDPLLVSGRVAVAAFLAGYSSGTRVSYTTDLRIFAGWCHDHDLNLFNLKRAHLELFGRWMEQEGRMASTIARRLSTLSSFYKYCQIEDTITKNPAANIRRPKVDCESRTLGLDRNELSALLVQAGLGDLRDGALIPLPCWRSTGRESPKRSKPTPAPDWPSATPPGRSPFRTRPAR